MAVQGFVRARRHQFGRQSSLNTPVAAVRTYPFKGVPDVDRSWTDPDVDVGSIDPVVAPHLEAPNITASLTDPSLRYNNLPLMLSAFFGGAETGGGTPDVTWDYAPTSDGSDAVDVATYEFGDDVVDDWYQLGDGLLESFEITGPEGLGALTASMSWRFGSMFSSGSTDNPDSPSVPTSLSAATDDIVVYLKDGEIAIASDPADFGTSQITHALHSFTLRCSRELDLKRFADGDQSFDIDDYATATRSIELECVFAKTSDTVGTGSESDAWMSNAAVNRFIEVKFTSLSEADTGTFYSWVFSMPARWYTRQETDSGGNTTITLTAHAFLDPDSSDTSFGGVFKTTVVNTLTAI